MKTTITLKVSDLTTIRLICGYDECGGVTEMTISGMAKRMKSNDCPLCGKSLVRGRVEDNPFYLLGLAFSSFLGEPDATGEIVGKFEVEFPVEVIE